MMKYLVAALIAVIATPALAIETTRTVSVPTADLNLRNPAGIIALDRRLAMAARQVCIAMGGRSLEERRQEALCRAEALAGVRANRDALVSVAQSTQVALLIAR